MTPEKAGRHMSARWYRRRNAQIVEAVRVPGATLTDVAKTFGISRNRVHQIIADAGVHGTWRGRTREEWTDAAIDAMTDPAHRTFADVARALGISEMTFRNWRRAHAPLRRAAATFRRLGRAGDWARARADIVVAYRAWRALAGRRPTTYELTHYNAHGVPPTLSWPQVCRYFGGIKKLNAAADDPTFPTEVLR